MIQDDKREREIIKLFGLEQNKNRKRHDIDAFLKLDSKTINFELKSSTVGSVSSASPLTLDHIQKWRKYHWIFGIYDKKTEKLQHCVYASPKMMKPWLDRLETDIDRGIRISHKLVTKIDRKMMYLIFGKKQVYSYEEAKKVYKKLYTPETYKKLQDKGGGYSEKRMLVMFREHNLAYLIRGSWLNNPKIPKEYYKNFPKIKNNWKAEIKKLVKGNI